MKVNKRLKIIFYLFFFFIILSLLILWIYFAKAWSRDYQRIGDLKIIQENFNYYHVRNGTFIIDNCQLDEDISNCFFKIFPSSISDPLNTGDNRYLVRRLYEDDYEIEFSLEVGVNELGPGKYILTKDGIRK